MSLDDWILALHVLSAFALVGAVLLFWILVVAVRRTDAPEATARLEPAARLGNAVGAAGSVGTLLFGLWLAFSVGGYDIWDGWIVAALVLWALLGWAGGRAGKAYSRGLEQAKELLASGHTSPSAELAALNPTAEGIRMHALSSALVVLLLVDMIWKPGA
ncbi:MAG TPA: hypothetical protein VNJ46_06500 [Gaiellaceae bacterium]|nr:hypothetical protein [Gaiellaceae bacterium]